MSLAQVEVPKGALVNTLADMAGAARHDVYVLRSKIQGLRVDEAFGLGTRVNDGATGVDMLGPTLADELMRAANGAQEVAVGADMIGVGSGLLGNYAATLQKVAGNPAAQVWEVRNALHNVDFGLGHGHGGMATKIRGGQPIDPNVTVRLGDKLRIPHDPSAVQLAVLEKFAAAAKPA